jgi:capsular exopolysaccharide synthesis family protein
MSRIYEALKQSSQEKLQSIANIIEGAESTVPESNHVRMPEPDVERELPERAAPRRAPEPKSASLTSPQLPQSQFRVERMQVPAEVPVFPFHRIDDRAAEQYRMLRTNLLQHPAQPKVIAVSSATPGDGKTVTAINLAGIFALKSQANVVIVDADLRSCSSSRVLGINPKPGLPDVLRGRCTPTDAICQIEQLPNLHFLPSYRDGANPAELLDSPNWAAAIAQLRQQFSIVIVDTTPIGAVADFKIVRSACDGVLMVVRPDHTGRIALSRAMEVEKNQLLGIVVNAWKDWFLWSTQDAYDYYPKFSTERVP